MAMNAICWLREVAKEAANLCILKWIYVRKLKTID